MESIFEFSDKQCQHNYPPAGAWQALCGAPGWSLEPGEVKSLKYHACAQNRASWNSKNTTKHTKTHKKHKEHTRASGAQTAAQSPPSTRAGGKDDGS